MTDREILDEVTLLLRNATEAVNGTAQSFDGEALSGFVLSHRDYMQMHCLLNVEPGPMQAADKQTAPPDDGAA